MFRSVTTQVMQNYFDINDRRSRENPTSLEAQLLNLAGVPLEDLDLRITREVNQSLQNVPVNIDSQGVYFGGPVPSSLITGSDQSSFTSVIGQSGNNTFALTPYNDTLPIPSRIEVVESVALSQPILFTLIGVGNELAQEFAVQYVAPGDFPIPNRLTLWLDLLGLNQVFINLTVTGEVAPRPAWAAERKLTTEVINIASEGVAYSRNRWASIKSIAVRGLPIGVRLRGWSMPFNLPASPDPQRAFALPEDRNVLYNRYWQPEGNLLKESYMASGLSGLELFTSYLTNESLLDTSVEPYTYGLYSISDSSLFYSDRREKSPRMDTTGLTREPLFGLQVENDLSQEGAVRYITLSGIPYARASEILQYRYLMVELDSISSTRSILPDGSFGPPDRGWRSGPPTSVSVPLIEIGDYIFRLEMQDKRGDTTVDVMPWKNHSFEPSVAIDISSIVATPKGIAFDSYSNLWIWTGSFALRLKVHYDGYIFDPDSQTIFTTDNYDTLQVT